MSLDAETRRERYLARLDVRLRSRVKLLGNLLGEVIGEQSGEEVLNEIIYLRKRFISLNKKDDARKRARLIRHIEGLDTPMLLEVIRGFSAYFNIVNIAQQNFEYRYHEFLEDHRILRPGSFDEALMTLQKRGAKEHHIQNLFNNFKYIPVFTAHPTEARRRTVMQCLVRILNKTKELDNAKNRVQEKRIQARMKREIHILWKTDEMRLRKPTPDTEVSSNLYFFNNALFEAIPSVYRHLERAIGEHFHSTIKLPTLINFGSWVGGDRDGNPFVTPAVTARTTRLQSITILEEYVRRIDILVQELSQSATLSKNDMSMISDNDRLINLPDYIWNLEREPYRQKLMVMRFRLLKRLDWLQSNQTRKQLPAYTYANAQNFLDDLLLVDKTLRANKDDSIADSELKDLIILVQTFGFHLCRLDARDESGKHTTAVAEILQLAGIEENYADLSESKKTAILNRLLEDKKSPEVDFNQLSKPSRHVMEVLKCIYNAYEEISPNVIGNYVISMTHSATHVLELMTLGKMAGLLGIDNKGAYFCHIRPSPLFETIDDLDRIEEIFSNLCDNPVFNKYIDTINDRSEIMLGYSDSCKDGGILSSSWHLYAAQRKIQKLGKRYERRIRVFHGRGGTIGRGGGPTHNALIAQPPSTIDGEIRITEQGEVISQKYGTPESSVYELITAMSGLIIATRHHANIKDKDNPEHLKLMSKLSTLGEKAYRELVDDTDGLIDFFYETTPVQYISQMNIGSRPTHRRPTERSRYSIRAIPWVFGWSLARYTLPAWYGLGKALETFHNNKPENLESLRKLYRNWPFFKTLMDNIQLALRKADMSIAEQHSHLFSDSAQGALIFKKIKEEHERTVDYMLKVCQIDKLMENQPLLKLVIDRRQPYLDTINHVQLILMKRLKNGQSPCEDTDRMLLLRGINAIASGMRNTG